MNPYKYYIDSSGKICNLPKLDGKTYLITKNSQNQDVLVHNYLMGSVEYPVLKYKKDAKIVEKKFWKNWAKDRLVWAIKNSKEEVPYLKKVIRTGLR